jgi:hypothetical protein
MKAALSGIALLLALALTGGRPAVAQYSAPGPIPGGLPGVAAPPAVRSQDVPAPPPATLSTPLPAQAPAAETPAVCDCHAEVEVPVYENGKIVARHKERQVTGRSRQCCGR